MRLPALLLLALLTLPMGQEVREALGLMVNLTVVSGEMIFVNGTSDVALKAKARDQFHRTYTVKVRWKGGIPVVQYISNPMEDI